MKKHPKVLLLYVLNWVLFVIFFALDIFDAYIFQSLAQSITNLPISKTFITILVTLWMIVPQTLILTAANKMYLRLPVKKFLLTQLLFGVSVVLVLYLALLNIKYG